MLPENEELSIPASAVNSNNKVEKNSREEDQTGSTGSNTGEIIQQKPVQDKAQVELKEKSDSDKLSIKSNNELALEDPKIINANNNIKAKKQASERSELSFRFRNKKLKANQYNNNSNNHFNKTLANPLLTNQLSLLYYNPEIDELEFSLANTNGFNKNDQASIKRQYSFPGEIKEIGNNVIYQTEDELGNPILFKTVILESTKKLMDENRKNSIIDEFKWDNLQEYYNREKKKNSKDVVEHTNKVISKITF